MPYADPASAVARASQRRASRRHYATHRQSEIQRRMKYYRDHQKTENLKSVKRRSQRMAPERVLWWNARNRAKRDGLEFTLTLADTQVPMLCPVLGIPLKIGTGHATDGSPSVDRIEPSEGYTSDNVRIISHKANTIKSNATLSEIRLVLAYMEKPHG